MKTKATAMTQKVRATIRNAVKVAHLSNNAVDWHKSERKAFKKRLIERVRWNIGRKRRCLCHLSYYSLIQPKRCLKKKIGAPFVPSTLVYYFY